MRNLKLHSEHFYVERINGDTQEREKKKRKEKKEHNLAQRALRIRIKLVFMIII